MVIGLLPLEATLLGEAQGLGDILPGEALLVEVTILQTTKVQILLEVHPEGTVEEAVQISLGAYPEEAIGEAEGTPGEVEPTQSEQSCTVPHNPWPVSSARRPHFKETAEARTSRLQKGPLPGRHKRATLPAGNRQGGPWLASNTPI